MSDERTRELERAAAGGDPDARAAWIAARLRAGALEAERVRLAAWVGDPGARLALGQDPAAPELAGPGARAAGLARWGLEPGRGRAGGGRLVAPGWRDQVLPRAALALACAALGGATLSARTHAALRAAEAWIEAPGEATAQAARAAGLALAVPGSLPHLEALAGLAALHCGPLEGAMISLIVLLRAAQGLDLRGAKELAERAGGPAGHMATAAAARAGEEAVLRALREALAPWALGAPAG